MEKVISELNSQYDILAGYQADQRVHGVSAELLVQTYAVLCVMPFSRLSPSCL